MGTLRTVTKTTRSLRRIEAFAAKSVEGPIHLTSDQCIMLPLYPAVLIAGGSELISADPHEKGDDAVYLTIDGVSAVPVDVDAPALLSVGTLGQATILGSLHGGELYRRADSTFTHWCQADVDMITGIQDIEENSDTGRVLALSHDRLAYSDDAGRTWTIVEDAPQIGEERSLAYSPVSGVWFMAVERDDGDHAAFVFRSFDDGLTWEPLPGLAGSLADNVSMKELGVNPITGRVVFGPDQYQDGEYEDGTQYRDSGVHQPFYTDDDGETIHESESSNDSWSRRWTNLAYSPAINRWIADAGSRYIYYSDDDGATWEYGLRMDSDTNDLIWTDAVEGREGFYRAGGSYSGLIADGDLLFSVDGLNWEVIVSEPDLHFNRFRVARSRYPGLDRRPILPVERYEQVQQWDWSGHPETGESAIAYVDREKHRYLGLNTALRDYNPDGDNLGNIPNTDLSEPKVQPPWHWPRACMCRIEGGYFIANGKTGIVSRYFSHPDELQNYRGGC